MKQSSATRSSSISEVCKRGTQSSAAPIDAPRCTQTSVIVIEFEDRNTINGFQFTEPKRIDQQLTYEFYDYNQPRTIKPPENYKP